MITLENLHSEHKRCLAEVVREEYYAVAILNCYLIAEQKYGSDTKWSAETFYLFWNRAWEMLPDSRAIHRKPFYLICDLAEGSYMEYKND